MCVFAGCFRFLLTLLRFLLTLFVSVCEQTVNKVDTMQDHHERASALQFLTMLSCLYLDRCTAVCHSLATAEVDFNRWLKTSHACSATGIYPSAINS